MREWGNWNEIQIKLQNELKIIFKDYNINNLSDYEKRKIIFEYLCQNLTYDFDKLNAIKEQRNSGSRLDRNPLHEILSVADNKLGICNAIAQYYKLLLEEVGVFSMCVICDDQTPVNHQLNLVYDDETATYSFDDITSVIVKRGSVDDFFDYDIETANQFGQGTRLNQAHALWSIWPTSIINYIVGKPDVTDKCSDEEEKFEVIVGKIRSKKTSKLI